MSYILCDMDCDQEINKSDLEEHCSDCLCVGEMADREQQDMPATKAWRSTSVVEGRGHPKTLSDTNRFYASTITLYYCILQFL